MKKNILLSMILLALCLIQASAADYYFRIRLYNDKNELEDWSNYIKVRFVGQQGEKGDWVNGLRDLVAGKSVTDGSKEYKLPPKANNENELDLDKIWGIAFANGNGRGINNKDLNIMEGDNEYAAWEQIRGHIKYLDLHEYQRDIYTNNSYFIGMSNVKELELPKDGMKVGDKDLDCNMYFANAGNLKKITIDYVDITDDAVKDKFLLDRVGKFMFSNCCSLSTKYINRLIKNVTEITMVR